MIRGPWGEEGGLRQSQLCTKPPRTRGGHRPEEPESAKPFRVGNADIFILGGDVPMTLGDTL